MEHTHTDHQGDLKEFVHVIRSRKWSILLITAALTGTALFFSFRQTPTYQATAKLLVTQFSLDQTSSSLDLGTEQGLVSTEPVAQEAARILRTHRPPGSLMSGLSVDLVPNSQFLLIHYSSPDAAFAASAANAFSNGYIKYRQQRATKQLENQLAANQSIITDVQKELDKANKVIQHATNPAKISAASAQHDQFVARLAILEQTQQTLLSQQAAIAQGGGQVVNHAREPGSPVSPNHFRTGTLALVLGLALGTGVAFLRERLDDSIRTHQELERRLGAPVLATVPRISGWRKRESSYLITLADPKSPVSESYRTLRTNLQFLASTRELKTLMVTSAIVGDGKSATATNLAVAVAQAGRRVILVSGDLRRPRVHRFLDMPNDIGLSTVLSDSTPLSRAARSPGIENLLIVPSGPVPPNPAELLQSDRMVAVLEQLREASDLVIIDTPPVLAVADASTLAPHADGTLFVVDAETASRAATSQARQQLEHAGARVIGAVFNKYDPNQAGGYSYYYYYEDQRAQQQEAGFQISGNGDEPGAERKSKWGWSRRGSKAQPPVG